MSPVLMLVTKDLLQQRPRLLLGVAIMAFLGLLTRATTVSPTMLNGVLAGLVTVTAMGTAYEEEQRHGLQFLRALPLSPVAAVAGKFLAVGAALAVYVVAGVVGLAAVGKLGALPLVQFLVAGCGGLALAGVALAVFYRHGYRAVQTAFMVGFFAAMIFGGVLGSPAASGLRTWVAEGFGVAFGWAVPSLAALGSWASAAPFRLGAVLLTGLVTLYTFFGWVAVRGLRRRDL